MIIFGWRTIVSTIGAVFKRMCDHCHNEDYWILTKTTRWFTLFFIPVIPLETKYFLACPVCKYGFALKGDQVKTISSIALRRLPINLHQRRQQPKQLRRDIRTSSTAGAVATKSRVIQSFAGIVERQLPPHNL